MIRLYNTLTRQKEEFIPRTAGEVSMYGCGPTTYNYFHLGNARMLVVFDMIRRYFLYRGYRVVYVQNFTDVDDKIIARAVEENKPPGEVAEFYIREYYKDARALNIMPASIHPKATEHIDEMIDIIRALEAKGLAYAVEGDVYFAVTRYEPYGKLSGRSLEDMRSGARVEINDRKENPMDFALWKKAGPGELSWGSPWGDGRPGWHIECSAMSYKYLGADFDIHGGGGDLVFPHHENEIAQSEAFMDGQRCARYWMHNAFITVKTSEDKEEKMSKSLGNFFLVREILQEGYSGEVIRFYLLSTHYRSPAVFDREKLDMAAKALDRLKTSVRLADEYLAGEGPDIPERPDGPDSPDSLDSPQVNQARQKFEEAMDDDFNSAQALAVLFDLARDLNSMAGQAGRSAELAAMRDTLVDLADTLGVDVTAKDSAVSKTDAAIDILVQLYGRAQSARDEETAEFIRVQCKSVGIDMPMGIDPAPAVNLAASSGMADIMDIVLHLRARAKKEKDWPAADLIRDCCKNNGIVIEDTREGVRWYIQDGENTRG
jgi:cysteinyl-tRNA synthetase